MIFGKVIQDSLGRFNIGQSFVIILEFIYDLKHRLIVNCIFKTTEKYFDLDKSLI